MHATHTRTRTTTAPQVSVLVFPEDTVASLVELTSSTLGVPSVFLEDQPPARLFDEGGMQVVLVVWR